MALPPHRCAPVVGSSGGVGDTSVPKSAQLGGEHRTLTMKLATLSEPMPVGQLQALREFYEGLGSGPIKRLDVELL